MDHDRLVEMAATFLAREWGIPILDNDGKICRIRRGESGKYEAMSQSGGHLFVICLEFFRTEEGLELYAIMELDSEGCHESMSWSGRDEDELVRKIEESIKKL